MIVLLSGNAFSIDYTENEKPVSFSPLTNTSKLVIPIDRLIRTCNLTLTKLETKCITISVTVPKPVFYIRCTVVPLLIRNY